MSLSYQQDPGLARIVVMTRSSRRRRIVRPCAH